MDMWCIQPTPGHMRCTRTHHPCSAVHAAACDSLCTHTKHCCSDGPQHAHTCAALSRVGGAVLILEPVADSPVHLFLPPCGGLLPCGPWCGLVPRRDPGGPLGLVPTGHVTPRDAYNAPPLLSKLRDGWTAQAATGQVSSGAGYIVTNTAALCSITQCWCPAGVCTTPPHELPSPVPKCLARLQECKHQIAFPTN